MSDQCKDLLTRLLVADAEQRMAMADIKSHPWFAHALPAGATDMNAWYMKETTGLEEVRHHVVGVSA